MQQGLQDLQGCLVRLPFVVEIYVKNSIASLCTNLFQVVNRETVKMPTLATTNFNIVLSPLGAWISLFGLVSYLCKESFYLSEARMCESEPLAPLFFSLPSANPN
jgi:hypothetical protein